MASLSELGSFGKFLGRATASGLLAATLLEAGCSPTPVAHPTVETGKPLNTPEVQDGKQFLLQAINGLPDSPIKTMLQHRISSFLQRPAPYFLDIPGIRIPAQNLEVRFEVANLAPGVAIGGTFAQKTPYNEATLAVATQDVDTYLPYVGFGPLNDSYPKLPDGTFLIPFKIRKGDKIQEGITPKITVTTPSTEENTQDSVRKKLNNDRKIWVATKEATQYALNQILAQMKVKKMQEAGLPITVQAKKPDGSIGQIEVISGVTNNLTDRKGRYHAAMDVTATVVVIKAFSPQDARRIVGTDPVLSQAVVALENIDLGTDEEQILSNALKWTLTHPLGKQIFHFGDFDNLP